MKKTASRRCMTALPLALVARVERVRELSGVDGAKPSESALLAALVARGVQELERLHSLPPIAVDKLAA